MKNLPSKRDAESVIMYYKNQEGVSIRALAGEYSLGKSAVAERVKRGETLKESLTYDEALYVLEVSTPERPKFFKEAIEEIYQKSTSVAGIQQREELSVLTSYGLNWGEDKKHVRKKVREQASRDGVEALFVPGWLVSEESTPKEIRDGLMVLADELHQRVNEMVSDFMYDNGISPEEEQELKSALVRLANDGLGGVPVSVMCKRLDTLVAAMSPDVPPAPVQREYRDSVQVIDLSLFNYDEDLDPSH